MYFIEYNYVITVTNLGFGKQHVFTLYDIRNMEVRSSPDGSNLSSGKSYSHCFAVAL